MKNREQETGIREQPEARPDGEQGFMLLGLIVAIAVILLVLGMAATNIAFSIRREREVESARRANQYVLAIRRFYAKTGRYPGSIQQLLNTNNIRYLRKNIIPVFLFPGIVLHLVLTRQVAPPPPQFKPLRYLPS